MNCALWSAEVYKDIDGSLQNIKEAYSRGKMLVSYCIGVHVNCALWSAEVYKDIDGSLQNIKEAYSRGKMLVSYCIVVRMTGFM